LDANYDLAMLLIEKGKLVNSIIYLLEIVRLSKDWEDKKAYN